MPRHAEMLRPVFITLILCLGASAQDLAWKQLPPLPDALGVAGAFAGTSGGALLVMGGANFPDRMPWDGGTKVWHDDVYVLESPDGAWKTAGKLPRPLAYGVSVQTDEGVLCIGGSDADRHYADVFLMAWNGHALTMHPCPPLPSPLANACGALVGGTVYVACGETKPNATQCSDACYAMTLSANDPFWKKLPPCPGGGRTLAAAASVQRRFLLMAGVTLSAGPDGKPVRRYLSTGYAYDPARNTWSPLPDLPKPAAAAPTPAPVLNNRSVFILGGDDGSLYTFQPLAEHPGFPGTVLAYDVMNKAWSAQASVPAPRATLTAILWRGMIVLPSGETRPGVRSPEVWAADFGGADR